MLRSLLLGLFLTGSASAQKPIRVLVWDEQQPEQKQAYGDKFLGETIAAHLATKDALTVKSTALSSPEQGLSTAQLDETDVLIFWSHKKNAELTHERAADIATRVQEGKLSLIVLHSAHGSKPFVKLMQARAIADARKHLGADVNLRYLNENPIGNAPKIDDEITPFFSQEEEQWVLTLPNCAFPSWRADGAASHVTTLTPTHPIARGLPAHWDIPQTEMYSEPFHVPKPDAVIFMEKWDKGETFRSGCVWNIGKGAVFYFRPGHETYPVYQQKEPLQVLENAIRWLHPAS
jgi:trehalose utilization protein